MARRRLIIHGSQEELEMFEPIYDTRLRLQHGTASTSRFHLPEPPPPSAPETYGYSERPEVGDHHEGTAVGNYVIQAGDDEEGSRGGVGGGGGRGRGGAAVEGEEEEETCLRSGSGDESENYDDHSSLPDHVRPQSTTSLTEDDDDQNLGVAEQGNESSEISAPSPRREAPSSDTSDSDSDSDS